MCRDVGQTWKGRKGNEKKKECKKESEFLIRIKNYCNIGRVIRFIAQIGVEQRIKKAYLGRYYEELLQTIPAECAIYVGNVA